MSRRPRRRRVGRLVASVGTEEIRLNEGVASLGYLGRCFAGVVASALRSELGGTHGELRPIRHAERRRGVCWAAASRRPRRRRVGRLVASVGTEEIRSNEDVAFLG